MSDEIEGVEKPFEGCFGCGRGNASGLGLRFRRDGERVVCDAQVDERFAGYRDLAHGGVIAAMLDEAMGWAMIEIAACHGVTRSLDVRYRRPVRLAEPLRVSAGVVERNGTDVKLEARVEDRRGRLLASATGEWAVVRRERAVAGNTTGDGRVPPAADDRGDGL